MLAFKLRMSVQRCKRETTSSEFVAWQQFFIEEANHFHRDDYFFAKIIGALNRQNAKHPQRINDKDFLIKFTTKTKQIQDPNLRQSASKAFWGGAMGTKTPKG